MAKDTWVSLICGWDEIIPFVQANPHSRIIVDVSQGNGACIARFPTEEALEAFVAFRPNL